MTRKPINTPVVLFIFRRLDTTKKVIDRIREVAPPKVYVIGEGYRKNVPGEKELVQQVRDMVERELDWGCEVHTNYVPEDIGVGKRMSSGIDWVFEHEEKAIFLEDDILADISFFYYADELLERYKNNEEVMLITGYKDVPEYPVADSYFFARHGSIWGWASWRRAWKHYDFAMKEWPQYRDNGTLKKYFYYPMAYKVVSKHYDQILSGFDTWDYQWDFARYKADGMAIIPANNLVINIGMRPDAAHTTKAVNGSETVGEMQSLQLPLKHPDSVSIDANYDKKRQQKKFGFFALAKKVSKKIFAKIEKIVIGK